MRGVEVDRRVEPLRPPVCHARDRDAGVAVPDEHRILEILVVEQVDDVGDVGLEVDARRA
jgi:hypothetical protein